VSEPRTAEERIEWLWQRLDALNAANASLTAALDQAERAADASRMDAERARTQEMMLAAEVARMATELNAARQSAADAVRDHIAATRAG